MSTPHTTPSPADGGSSAVDRRIWLIGVDGSDASRHAALWATRHATGRAEALELLEAWHVPASVAGSPAATMVSGHDLGLYEKSACEHVSGLAAELASTTSLPIDTTVACGRAASVVVEASRRSDLLVLGTRGRGGFARLVLDTPAAEGGRPRELGADFEIEFHEGVVRRDLQREAGRADLLVMGARGHGAVGAALLGSVSTWLLHHVERPMVIVPHHE